MFEAEAKERQRASGGDRKSEQYKESVVEKIPQPIEPTRSIDQAAKAFGVNPRYIQEMKRIEQVAPEKVEEIKNGSKTISAIKQKGADIHYCWCQLPTVQPRFNITIQYSATATSQ